MKKKYFSSVYGREKRRIYEPRGRSTRRLAGKALGLQVKRTFNRRTFAGGFTLIELLVVIGIIAILAAVVIAAVNPARQFMLARDTQRTANVSAILNAVGENMSEHKGLIICGSSPIPFILSPDSFPVKSGGMAGDIAQCLVPNYIAAMPYDPSAAGAGYTSTTSYDTGYSIAEDANGHITVSAKGELTKDISATR